jgi:hypothetical protein
MFVSCFYVLRTSIDRRAMQAVLNPLILKGLDEGLEKAN